MSTKRKKHTDTAQPSPTLAATVPFSDAADLRAIIEVLGDGIITYNHEGQAIYYNPAARHMLGWDKTDIDPCSLSTEESAKIYQVEIVSGHLKATPANWVSSIQAGESVDAQEWRVHRSDGTIIYVEVRRIPIFDRTTGAVLGAFHVFHDTTAWHDLNDIKEEFIKIASHELRAPLQPLMMASRFMQNWVGRPERQQDVRDLAEEIIRQSKRMSRLISDMLDMTRISGGLLSIDRALCDITAIVQNVADEQYAITQRAMLVAPSDAPILGIVDGERLWQALTNLVANAVKYSLAPAPVSLAVTQFMVDDMPWARIKVQDQGCGIPADQLPHLFERYYRASLSNQLAPQHQDSLGLGLYISHAIVQAHGGRIGVESVVNVGSTFTLEIPLAFPAAPAAPVQG